MESVETTDNTITGVFLDQISPTVTKKFNFVINAVTGEVSYDQIDTGDLDFSEEVDFAVKKSQTCKEGKSAGCTREDGSVYCIALGKKCKSVKLAPKEVKAVKEVIAKAAKVGKVKTTKTPKSKAVRDTTKVREDQPKTTESKAKQPVIKTQNKAESNKYTRIDSELQEWENAAGTKLKVSKDGHLLRIDDPLGTIEAYVGDKDLSNPQLALGKTPQLRVLAKKEDKDLKPGNDFFYGINRDMEDIAASLPNTKDLVTIRLDKVSGDLNKLIPNLTNSIASQYREGSTVVIRSDDPKVRTSLNKLGFIPYPKRGSNIYVTKVSGEGLVPESVADIKSKSKLGRDVNELRYSQMKSTLFGDNEEEDRLANKIGKLEDEWLGRKPKQGVVKSKEYYEKEAEKWSKELGLDEEANGFSKEATKAHDVAHPVVREMLGMDSEQIRKSLGGLKNPSGKPNLLVEEAIVNIAEHLSRGDDFDSSLLNGVRLAKALSRNMGPKNQARVRTKEFRDALEDLAIKLYKNDNFNEYMKIIRDSNRVSGTVLQRGDDFSATVR